MIGKILEGEEQIPLTGTFPKTLPPSIRTFNESEALSTLDTCLLSLALRQQILGLRIVHRALILPLDSDSSKIAVS